MKGKQELGILLLLVLLLIPILAINSNLQPKYDNRKLSKVIFYVS